MDDAWGHDGPPVDPQFSYVPLNRQPKKKRKGSTPEAKVSKANDRYLATLPCMVLRTSAGMTEINGRKIRIGKAGTSDKTILFPGGRWVSLEEKATTTLTDDQKKYRQQVIALGGAFIESRSVADTRDGLIKAFGLITVNDWEKLGAAKKR